MTKQAVVAAHLSLANSVKVRCTKTPNKGNIVMYIYNFYNK